MFRTNIDIIEEDLDEIDGMYTKPETFSEFLIFENKGGLVDLKKLKSVFNNNEIKNIIKEIIKHKDMQDLYRHYKASKEAKVYFYKSSIALKVAGSKIRTSEFKNGAFTSFPGGSLEKYLLESGINLLLSYDKSKRITAKNKLIFLGLYALLIDNRATAIEDKTENAETQQISQAKGKLKDLKSDNGLYNIKIGSVIYKIKDFETIQNRPKADAVLIDEHDNPVVFISLKKGMTPANFQQYGGSKDIQMDNKTGKVLLSSGANKDVSDFLSKVKKAALSLGATIKDDKVDFSTLPKGSNFAQEVNSPEVIGVSLFGSDFGSNKFGLNNCTILIDGDIIFKEVKDKVYEIGGTFHSLINPNHPGSKYKLPRNSDYYPNYIVVKSNSQKLNQAGFLNARFNIWPNNKVVKRYKANLENILKSNSIV